MLKHRMLAHGRERPLGRWTLIALGAFALGASSCMARAGVGGGFVYTPPVVDVEVVPTQVEYIEYYPRHRHQGVDVYLVDGRWYYQSGSRWVVYRSEPRDLATVRVSYEAKYGKHYRPRHPRPEHASPPPRRPHGRD